MAKKGLRHKIGLLLNEAREATSQTDYIIIGSLSVLGAHETPPPQMVTSTDVDLYPKQDPGRAAEVSAKLGFGSAFEARHGIFADAVSPNLAALPDGWQDRLVKVEFGKAVGWFLDPNDAAISKYVRGEPRDRLWIMAGLESGVLSMPIIDRLLPITYTATTREASIARVAIAEDKKELGLRNPATRPTPRRLPKPTQRRKP